MASSPWRVVVRMISRLVRCLPGENAQVDVTCARKGIVLARLGRGDLLRQAAGGEYPWCHQNVGATPSLENRATPSASAARGHAAYSVTSMSLRIRHIQKQQGDSGLTLPGFRVLQLPNALPKQVARPIVRS